MQYKEQFECVTVLREQLEVQRLIHCTWLIGMSSLHHHKRSLQLLEIIPVILHVKQLLLLYIRSGCNVPPCKLVQIKICYTYPQHDALGMSVCKDNITHTRMSESLRE